MFDQAIQASEAVREGMRLSSGRLIPALAGCMEMDLIHILQKGRHDLRGLRARLIGHRAPEDPRRFTEVALHFTISGPVPAPAVQRAIDLSREKYCSVWSSMRQDMKFDVTFDIS